MSSPALLVDPDGVDTDHIAFLHDLSWKDYESLLRMRGDRSAPRISYLEGEVEIMSPSRGHEGIKSMIGRLVETWCLERGIRFRPLGSWTLKERRDRRGAEADECYIFGEADAERPHLAIEGISTDQAALIREAVRATQGPDARVRLFGSRTDDSARGGDIDLLVEVDRVLENRAAAASRLAAQCQIRLGDHCIDVVLVDPSTAPQPIHARARARAQAQRILL
jgi:predicted nucleotidyltransferase